ncbi:hypothetical protein Tco_1091164 [Tanacetum coccineum]|uniref:Uncharacterized protein n=1 Tax=Tanacetum coccineum TaxID=301880 RepID=A0ABQ5I6F2_9ASTR
MILARKHNHYIENVLGTSSQVIQTKNSFDVLNVVEKDVGVAPSDSINSIGDDVNVENSKDVNLDNEDNDRENNVEEDDNKTGSSMALKCSKGSSFSKSEGGTGRKNLYER